VQLQIKDSQFKLISRQKSLSNPTSIASELAQGAMQLLYAAYNGTTPIRMLTVTAANLVEEGEAAEQVSFFGEQPMDREKKKNLGSAIDLLRGKFGQGMISTGAILGSDIGLEGGHHHEDEE
jgi:DNA polymerase-4